MGSFLLISRAVSCLATLLLPSASGTPIVAKRSIPTVGFFEEWLTVWRLLTASGPDPEASPYTAAIPPASPNFPRRAGKSESSLPTCSRTANTESAAENFTTAIDA